MMANQNHSSETSVHIFVPLLILVLLLSQFLFNFSLILVLAKGLIIAVLPRKRTILLLSRCSADLLPAIGVVCVLVSMVVCGLICGGHDENEWNMNATSTPLSNETLGDQQQSICVTLADRMIRFVIIFYFHCLALSYVTIR